MIADIKAATESDAATLLKLDREIFGDAAYSTGEWQGELTAAGSEVFCAYTTEDKTIVGFLTILRTLDTIEIKKIGILPTVRRQGIASQLIRQVVENQELAEQPTRLLLEVSTTNTAAQAFYAQLGFREIARRHSYYTDGSAAVVMEFMSPV